MNPKVTWALILSGLVCPGAGQIYNRQTLKGLGLIAATVASIGVLIVKVTQETLHLLTTDPSLADPALAFALAHRIQAENVGFLLLVLGGLLAIWAIGIWDAWRVASSRAAQDAEAAF